MSTNDVNDENEDIRIIEEDDPDVPEPALGGEGATMAVARAIDEDANAPELDQSEDELQLRKMVAKAARDERLRLMPEYLENYFIEDLPPISPDDPFNQGIYMRFRINQMRQAEGKQPVE